MILLMSKVDSSQLLPHHPLSQANNNFSSFLDASLSMFRQHRLKIYRL